MTQAPDSTVSESARGRPAILAEGLKKAFGKVKALDGVDVSVQPGTIMAMLGPNGAGKTTFVGILATLMRPDRIRLRENECQNPRPPGNQPLRSKWGWNLSPNRLQPSRPTNPRQPSLQPLAKCAYH